MTLKALIAQANRIPCLVGGECVRAHTGAYDWALLLDFGTLHPPDAKGYREPEKGLIVECPWRLETPDKVIISFGDEGDSVDLGIQVCVGKRVTRADVYRPSYMVHVEFSDGLVLWTFPDDSRDYVEQAEYPRSPWYLTGRAIGGHWEE